MTTVSSGTYCYEIIDNWAKLPEGWTFGILVGVAVDSEDRVYVCHQRNDPPILVFDRDGNLITSWGTGEINEGHLLYIGDDDVLYFVDRGVHIALKLAFDGSRLLEIGNRGLPSDTGVTELGGRVLRPGAPFNMPTRLVPSPSGDLYASDGYRNSRIHRFSSDGTLISSWGEFGSTDPGKFHLPHSLWVDKEGLVYVCDRKNHRIQIFTPTGDFVSEWPNLVEPVDICMDSNENVFVHLSGGPTEGKGEEDNPSIIVLDKQGKKLAQWDTPYGHQIWVDRHDDIYMAVCWEQRVMKYVRKSLH